MTGQKIPKNVNELIKQGQEDGFIVIDDIFYVYPEPEKSVEEIDDFFDKAILFICISQQI